MSKAKKNLHPFLSGQGSLFSDEITEGGLDVSLTFRDALSKALGRCKDSRWHIAAKISELTRHNITKDMLDKYTSGNLDYGFRAEDLTAFCAVTGSLIPFRMLLAPLNCDVIDPTESKHIKLIRLEQENHRLLREIEQLQRELGMR